MLEKIVLGPHFYPINRILAFLRDAAARLMLRRGARRTEPEVSTDIEPSMKAWNNFIWKSDPEACEVGSPRWAAAMAADAQGLILNGGVNSFLTNSWDLDPRQVVEAFTIIGAKRAAQELKVILDHLGQQLPTSSPRERWDALMEVWTDTLNERDSLSGSADVELRTMLEAHVEANQAFYLALA